ncbi:MAG: PD40 domain-containing protein [Bacteroidia bacterium]|nr:PD40 domain-containing protein [Bacteroidia bacterium]
MSRRLIWTTLILLIFRVEAAEAQSFGGNKWSQKWYQLNIENAKVIYPEGLESNARRVLDIIDFIQKNHRATVGLQTDKISLVLNNRTNISNGYVGLAPFRSEFFTTPFQNSFALGSLPWLDLLTIHEYRHVLQYSNGRRGLSRFLSVVFGQSALAGALNITLPDWYFEGDAVMSESSLTPQGRGRIPYFLRGFKAYELEGTRFPYDKVRNGSFKDFIPDHYRFGYMISKYGSDEFGPDFWPGVLADAGSFKGLLYPFSKAIRRRTSLTTSSLYATTFDNYKNQWGDVETRTKRIENENLTTKEPSEYTNYRFPKRLDNGDLICIRSGFNETPAVYTVKNGKEKRLFSIGINTENYMDSGSNLITWSELRFHPTRGNIDYSVIMTYDLSKKVKSQITFGTRYFSPSVHPSGTKLVIANIDEMSHTNLRIISSRNGSIIKELKNDPGYFITYPKWNPDGSTIYFAARNDIGQMAVCSHDIETDEINALTEWSFNPIGVPDVSSSHVYYSQSSSDAEHIYRVDISSGQVEQITSRPYGVYFPNVENDDEILYSEYTSNGLRLKSQTIRPFETNGPEQLEKTIRYNGYGENILNKINPVETTPNRYGNLRNAINFHSWGVTADDTNAAILIESDNILNSVSLFGGYQYLFDDKRGIWTAGARLGFVYPYLEARYSLEDRSFINQEDGRVINYNEHTVRLGADFPINLSSGPYLRSFIPHYDIERILLRGPLINDIDFNSHEIGLAFINRRIRAHREIMSKFSQFVLVQFRNSLDDLEAKQINVESEMTFPGVFPNHVIRLELDYKRAPGVNDYRFSDRFDYSRGYESLVFKEREDDTTVDTDRAIRFGINYHLPLLYPEFGIGGIAYLKRIQANVFYDISRVTKNDRDFNRNSIGGELIFDTNFFNTVPIALGLRYAHGIDVDFNIFEFFIPFYRL